MDVLEYLKQEGFEFVEKFNSANTTHYKFINEKGVPLIITMLGATPINFNVKNWNFDSLKEAISFSKEV